MSEENVEVVRAGIEAWNRGDWDAALKDMAPGAEFDMSRALNPDLHGVYGLDQVRGVFDELAGTFESTRIRAARVHRGR